VPESAHFWRSAPRPHVQIDAERPALGGPVHEAITVEDSQLPSLERIEQRLPLSGRPIASADVQSHVFHTEAGERACRIGRAVVHQGMGRALAFTVRRDDRRLGWAWGWRRRVFAGAFCGSAGYGARRWAPGAGQEAQGWDEEQDGAHERMVPGAPTGVQTAGAFGRKLLSFGDPARGVSLMAKSAQPPHLLALIFVLLCFACDERARGSGGAAPLGQSGALPSRPVPTKEAEGTQEPTAPAPSAATAAPGPEARPLTTRFHLGPIDDVGPAGPMTATSKGVLLVSREDRLYLAHRDGPLGFVPLQAPRELFSRYGRGPALGREHAYFVSNSGKLCRGHLKTGALEVLAPDARAGARVSVVSTKDRDLVGYIAGAGDEALGFLWAEGTSASAPELVRLSPEGSEATSITLVPTTPHPHAVLLEGRSGMSPLHARRMLTTARKVTLEPDRVVWVGPGSHSLTEVVSLMAGGDDMMAFLATAKDVTHFGLAQLSLHPESAQPAEPLWRPYPNGLDPAPVAAAHFCGRDFAIYAVPQHEKPRAPQDLVLAPIEDEKLGQEEILAHSRAYSDISVAALDSGALIAWTADHRTWAMVIGCQSPG